jgi:hypothetical protein
MLGAAHETSMPQSAPTLRGWACSNELRTSKRLCWGGMKQQEAPLMLRDIA